MRVEDFLKDTARRLPDKCALVADGVRTSYAELDAMSDRLAAYFVQEGIKPGDRIVIFMGNRLEAVVAIFAAQKAGAVFSPVNPSTKAGKLGFILNNCDAVAVVTEGRLGPVAAEAIALLAPSVRLAIRVGGKEARIAPKTVRFEQALDEGSGAVGDPGIEIDLSMLIYTSGSTGMPKGVMMTHLNVVTAARSIITYLGMTEEDIVLSVLPISFDYGLYQILMAVRTGATLVLEKSFAFPVAILERLAEERATGFPLVPTMAAMLLKLEGLKPGAFPHLRFITNTAAALPVAHILALQRLFPETEIFSMYGMTECKRCTYLPPEHLRTRPGSVGIAIPGTQAFVVDENGAPLPPGQEGELVIRGAHVMKGYWKNPEATQKVLKPGPLPGENLLHTGDLFRSDDEGFLYFVGRKDDIIKSRGEKVAPKEVETVLHELPGVSEAVVIGLPDPVLGHAVNAVIVLAGGATVDKRDLLRHCRQRLEDFAVPVGFEFRDELPKTANGKVDRRLLGEMLMQEAQRHDPDPDSPASRPERTQ
ncbi:MAG: AMP-binding protein [Maritimibacter sp.]|nr:AMP-binding protein [Maritimibacter sp.]